MRAFTLLFTAWMAPAAAAGQQPSAAGARSGQVTPQKPSASAPPPAVVSPESYSYQPQGRRDPFVNVLGAGFDARISSQRPDGAAGITVGELSVRATMKSRDVLIAMIQGPDNRAYVVRPGDKLLDGVIKSVTLDGLVIVQEVNDPLSLVKQREVTKRLRSLEDAKP